MRSAATRLASRLLFELCRASASIAARPTRSSSSALCSRSSAAISTHLVMSSTAPRGAGGRSLVEVLIFAGPLRPRRLGSPGPSGAFRSPSRRVWSRFCGVLVARFPRRGAWAGTARIRTRRGPRARRDDGRGSLGQQRPEQIHRASTAALRCAAPRQHQRDHRPAEARDRPHRGARPARPHRARRHRLPLAECQPRPSARQHAGL